MKIGIYAAGDDRVFTTDTLHKEPLGGIQTQVILLSRELSKYHEVYVFNPIEEEGDYGGVYYVSSSNLCHYTKELDTIIVVNVEAAMMEPWIEDTPHRILWKHHNDVFCLPPEELSRFHSLTDEVVCVSDDNMDQYSRHYESDKYIVIYLAVDTEACNPKAFSERGSNMVYTSCPNRGLLNFNNILPPLYDKNPSISLDVYGTWAMYGQSWEGDDDKYRELEEYRNMLVLPNFTQRVSVPYYELLDILSTSLLLAYPCTFIETFCLSIGVAMACGLPVVTTHVGAIKSIHPDNPYSIPVPNDDTAHTGSDWYTEEFVNHILELTDTDAWENASKLGLDRSKVFSLVETTDQWRGIIE